MRKLIILIICLLAGGGIWAEEIARIVAAVNNQVVTSKDVDDYCAAMAYKLDGEQKQISCDDPAVKKEALRRLIDDKIVLAEAKKGQLEVPRGMVDERLNKIILSYPSREEFELSLVEKGLTITSLREILEEKILMQSIVEFNVKSFINVSPQEISDFYQKNKESFKTPQTYAFYIAESYDHEELKAIGEVIDSEGIERAHKKFGALLFPVESTREELKRELGDLLFRLTDGSYDIETIEGRYYFVYKDHVNEPRLLTIKDVQGQIHQYLTDAQFKDRFTEWLSQLRETAVIKHYDSI